ncbi:MAG: GDSL-type esterase/lipase family protein [Desulfotomaculaceae bacterium]|nr:GDSL-type esterase/lipase family protein [Desulfotomaculaceae bacterium]
MIKSIKGDITELDFDAIVNAANSRLSMSAGVAGVIKKKGGAAIEEEAAAKGPIPVGEAVVTGAGMLKARHIIHAAAMGVDLITNADNVRSATRNALLRAEELSLESIALPALGTGVGGLDFDLAARVMVCEARRHVASGSVLKQIAFVLFDEHGYNSFNKITDRETVVCLGDSITYGFPFGPEASWVELSAKGLGLNMINKGANGDTTRAMRRRFARDVTALDPAYVIIMGGGNDAFMGYSLEKFEENVEAMVAEAQDNGSCPVIGLPAPVSLGSFVTDEVGIASCELNSYREWAEEFAANEELPILDFYRPLLDPETGRAVPAYFCDDVHPSIKGYQVLAKASERLLANIKNGL